MKTSPRSSLTLDFAVLASATCTLAQTSGTYNNQTAGPPGPMQNGQTPNGSMQHGPAPYGSMQSGPAPQRSVRAGSLNYLEGQVSANGQSLNLQAVGHFGLQKGQSLETADGYAEILLTPGAFLRVGQNSAFLMTAVGLADCRIQLIRGTALLEVDQIITGTHLEVTVGTTSLDLLKKGLYSFTANAPEVKVFDGKASVVGLNKARDIGKHDQILLANNDSLKKSSFDEKQAKDDPLYVWSEARSRDEAAQNKLVAQNSDGYSPAGTGWFWDPYTN